MGRRLAWFTLGWSAAAACLLVMSAWAATPPRSRASRDSQVPLRYQRRDLFAVPPAPGGGGVQYGYPGQYGSGGLY